MILSDARQLFAELLYSVVNKRQLLIAQLLFFYLYLIKDQLEQHRISHTLWCTETFFQQFLQKKDKMIMFTFSICGSVEKLIFFVF